MVPEFDTAAFSQTPAKVGAPVKSPFGYHLILVDERTAKSLEEMKPTIEKAIRPELANKEIEGIKKSNPIAIDDGYFGK